MSRLTTYILSWAEKGSHGEITFRTNTKGKLKVLIKSSGNPDQKVLFNGKCDHYEGSDFVIRIFPPIIYTLSGTDYWIKRGQKVFHDDEKVELKVNKKGDLTIVDSQCLVHNIRNTKQIEVVREKIELKKKQKRKQINIEELDSNIKICNRKNKRIKMHTSVLQLLEKFNSSPSPLPTGGLDLSQLDLSQASVTRTGVLISFD